LSWWIGYTPLSIAGHIHTMSKSYKDGVRGGTHKHNQNREVWSKRCKKVNMWPVHSKGWKRITHRYERRLARKEIESSLTDMTYITPSTGTNIPIESSPKNYLRYVYQNIFVSKGKVTLDEFVSVAFDCQHKFDGPLPTSPEMAMYLHEFESEVC
jgi:hypothetical protein